MVKRLALGDLVTVQPVYDNDPYLVKLQRHARIAELLPPADGEWQYMIELLATVPRGEKFGPFPQHRLVPGHGARS